MDTPNLGIKYFDTRIKTQVEGIPNSNQKNCFTQFVSKNLLEQDYMIKVERQGTYKYIKVKIDKKGPKFLLYYYGIDKDSKDVLLYPPNEYFIKQFVPKTLTTPTDWFYRLFGFIETTYANTKKN